jgi:serine/threonine-protein kinase
VILHVYGLLFIVAAANVLTRIYRIDYSKPVDDIRGKLDSLTKVYLTFAPLIGFPWWLMWIPLCVALGFDAVLHPSSLVVSLVVGVIGLSVSLWLYFRAIRPGENNRESRRRKLAGRSITTAYQELDEIDQANIR